MAGFNPERMSALGLLALLAACDGAPDGIDTDVAALEAENFVLQERLDTLEAALATVQKDLTNAQSDIETIESAYLPSLADYVSVDTANDAVIISGANIYIQDGSGSTRADKKETGLGNVIIGYDEDNGDDKTGSHNLVVGPYHSYSGFGGAVTGYDNDARGEYVSVLGGIQNTASGNYASVTGGQSNTAAGKASHITGGLNNMVPSGTPNATITAGVNNLARGHESSILGGEDNMTTIDAARAVVVGGQSQTCSSIYEVCGL